MHESILVVSDEELTDIQIEDLKSQYNIYAVNRLPITLSKVWNGINPMGQLDTHKFRELREFVLTKKQEGCNYIYIKGDRGAEFYMVSYAFIIGMQPLYSTTYRTVHSDLICGEKTEDQHVFFRKYVQFELR